MNTIKFYDEYDLRHETHNVGIYQNDKTININGKEIGIEDHAGLMIYPSIYCNANCYFCLNKFIDTLKYCNDLDINNYLHKLEEVLEILKPINPRISICGGEPSISPKLIPILDLVKDKGFNFRTFPTNGTGLLLKYHNKSVIQYLYDYGFIDNINLSLVSYKMDLNDKIMGINGHISNRDLKTIAMFTNINHMDLRISTVLIEGITSTLSDMIDNVEYYSSIGIKSIMFRELMDFGKGIIKSKVDILPIIQQIRDSNEFMYLDTLVGSYYDVEVYKFRNKVVKCYIEKQKPKSEQKIRDFIFYSNGDLYGFCDNKNIKLS